MTYGVDLLRRVMLGLNTFHPGLSIAVMLGFTLIMFAIAVFEFNLAE
jgi:hypothetical protein